MKIYAIADLHLAISVPNKNMNVFGFNWEGYMQRLSDNWKNTCKEDDIIIVAGDISWAMNLEGMREDFWFLEDLPGVKLLFKGNHDYWWETASKLDKYKDEMGLKNTFFIHNESYVVGDTAICGTRGWLLPDDKKFTSEDRRIYERELGRLGRSLESARLKGVKEIIAAFHYPPFPLSEGVLKIGEFIEVLKKYDVKKCVFGHIHTSNRQFERWQEAALQMSEETKIKFYLISADYLGFKPFLLQ